MNDEPRSLDELQIDYSCASCNEDVPENECSNSRRTCKHHCNCSWTQDKCCWCGKEFGEVKE